MKRHILERNRGAAPGVPSPAISSRDPSGEATVDFVDPDLASIGLRAGWMVRLEAGMRTVWTVRETLRKVYVALG
jgi:hypothetical protein